MFLKPPQLHTSVPCGMCVGHGAEQSGVWVCSQSQTNEYVYSCRMYGDVPAARPLGLGMPLRAHAAGYKPTPTLTVLQ